ncbi:hypothetical protein ACS0TY_002341 [Phlomoides rotata]
MVQEEKEEVNEDPIEEEEELELAKEDEEDKGMGIEREKKKEKEKMKEKVEEEVREPKWTKNMWKKSKARRKWSLIIGEFQRPWYLYHFPKGS